MSRLLHAAARGARIEKPYKETWVETQFVLTSIGDWQRIHPENEAYQYGPISTALRKKAENNTWCSGWEWFLAEAAANEFTEFFDSRIAEPDYPLFYLILAEALADEGL
jgi:hypothetical protein